jgi:hypothetical protein
MESSPEEAVKNNILSTKKLALLLFNAFIVSGYSEDQENKLHIICNFLKLILVLVFI